MKQKIVYVIHGLNIGGLEKQLIQHVSHLVLTDKYEVTIVTISETSDSNNLYDELPPGINLVEMVFRHVYSFGSYLELRRILKQLQPDIVISSQFLANTAVRAIRPFLKYKVIAREHNVHPEWTILHKLINTILFRISTDIYLAVSKEAAKEAASASLVSEKEVLVIENGIDLNVWQKRKEVLPERLDICQEFQLDTKRKYLLCVARLTEKKRIDRLLYAFALVAKEDLSVDLLIVGDGVKLSVLTDLVNQLDIARRVRFMGSQKNVGKFYNIAEMLVISSDQEGFPNVSLEALFFQLPIVSTPIPGISSVITDPLIGKISSKDHSLLSQDIIHVMNRSKVDKDQQQLLSASQVKNFGIERIVNKYIELFDAL